MVIALVGVLAYLLLLRLTGYREMAEKAAMEQTAGAIQSALNIQFAHALVRGDGAAAEALGRENPVRWLTKAPENYAGEHAAPARGAIPPGNWYFDPDSRELVYLVRHPDHFRSESGEPRVRYRVRLYAEETGGRREVSGVVLERQGRYRWILGTSRNPGGGDVGGFLAWEPRHGRGFNHERSVVHAEA